jgi:hypothetical protein
MLGLENSKRTTLSYLLHSRLFDMDVIETDLCGKGGKRDECVALSASTDKIIGDISDQVWIIRCEEYERPSRQNVNH